VIGVALLVVSGGEDPAAPFEAPAARNRGRLAEHAGL
jgi:hypothetical protein